MDIGFIRNSQKDSDLSQSIRKNLKLVGESSFPYDLNEFHRILSLGFSKNWYASKGKFGFSTVWGATWKPFISLPKNEWQSAYDECDNYVFPKIKLGGGPKTKANRLMISRQCSCFAKFGNTESIYSNWQVISSDSNMAIYDDLCVFCGGCQVGCSYDAIWTSSSLFEICESHKNFIYTPNTYIIKVIEMENKVTVTNSEEAESKFDNVFLCAGPIGNARILLESKLVPSGAINLQDSQMITIPFINFKGVKKHKGAYTLSGKNIDFRLLTSPHTSLHLQLYAHIDLIAERILLFAPRLLRRALRLFLNIFKNHLYIGILYVDPEWSGTLTLTLAEGKTEATTCFDITQRLPRIKSGLNTLIKAFGIIPVWPLAKIGSVGDSYHVGAAKELITDEYGQLLQSPRVFVGGSFSLPIIEAGPITMTSMAQCIRMVNRFTQSTKDRR
jgi:ferredoxin